MAGSVALALVFAGLAPLAAQKRVSSERDKLPPELGERPASMLKTETLKGTLKSVDLQKRTVTVTHSEGEETLGFPTAAGREVVKLSKKASRSLGKKSLRLEDLQAGWQLKVAYYPALGQVMELTIEELGR
jgi:hypothetical protein